jgi:hypothetical protein
MTRRFLSPIVLAGWLVANGLLRAESTNTALARSVVLESNVAYLCVNEVTTGLAGEIQSAETALAATNRIAGTVLDLRFADGDNLDSAKLVAELFAGKKLPLAILVNSGTHGAAESLASELRGDGDGLVFGSPAGKLNPDIVVVVKIQDEKKYLADPYAALAQSETNDIADTNRFSAFIDHTSEADLVREKIKDGEEDEDSEPPRPTEPPKPYIHDPVLARAVDLIKALGVMRQSRG